MIPGVVLTGEIPGSVLRRIRTEYSFPGWGNAPPTHLGNMSKQPREEAGEETAVQHVGMETYRGQEVGEEGPRRFDPNHCFHFAPGDL